MNKSNYEYLFKEGKIGSQTIKNRIVVTPVGLTYADSNGEAGEHISLYLEERAKGGAGIVMPGIVLIDSKTGKINPNELCLENQAQCMSFAQLAKRIHKYDAKIYLQLYHPGKCTTSKNLNGRKAWSCSPVPTANGEDTKEMTKEDIAYIVERFANSAALAEKAGIDGVEIHAAHGYLLNQFISPIYNKREDEYGGSIENRARIVVEIYNAIRAATSNKFTVGIRVSASEFVEAGNTLKEGVEFSKIWDGIGVDYINVNCGLQESSQFNREPPKYQQGWKKYLAKTIKAKVSCPIIAVNTIKKPDFAESLIGDGVCDFVGLSRPHLADPFWTKKVEQGKENQIRTCISCLNCMDTFIKGVPPTCSVNPILGREREFQSKCKNGSGRNVVVVGGGPGGMQAAMTLAGRNFHVILFEEKESLGGQLNYAEKPPFKEKITWLKEGMIEEVKAAGVEIKTGHRVTVEEIKEYNPLGVFLCAGPKPRIPMNIEGIDRESVFEVFDVLEGNCTPEGPVAVIGGGLTGIETALYLAEKGLDVNIVEMCDEIGKGVFQQCLKEDIDQLNDAKVSVYINAKLSSVKEGKIIIEREGKCDEIKANSVVLAMGSLSDDELISEYKAVFDNLRIVGEVQGKGKIINAITDGFTKAWVFEEE